jgi:hypothetical protein
MSAAEWVLFDALCDVDGCGQVARWTQSATEPTARVNCPQHPHQPLMAALHTYLRRIG